MQTDVGPPIRHRDGEKWEGIFSIQGRYKGHGELAAVVSPNQPV